MENPRHWRLKAQRLRLQGIRCPACGSFSFPPRSAEACPYCGAQPARLNGPALAVFPAPVPITSIEPQAPYRIAERITG